MLKDIGKQLGTFNEFSKTRFAEISIDIQKYIGVLTDIHKEMDAIRYHLKAVENRLKTKYPKAYSNAETLFPLPKDLSES